MKYKRNKSFIILIFASILIVLYKYKNISLINYKINNDLTKINMVKLNMNLNESLFWNEIDFKHGYKPLKLDSNTNLNQYICNQFFSVWPSDCTGDSNKDLKVRVKLISLQMVIMNATFTLFVTSLNGCNIEYPNIIIKEFNINELLISYKYNDIVINKINKWNKKRYTRISDILRLCLAHKYSLSYIDTDVHFLELVKNKYMISYIGICYLIILL